MPLQAPKLDDRHFQNLVDEAKKRIPLYCPEWTDHNVSDPGVTLIELFAWMIDMLLYRVNKVPELHYIKMMEMLGVTLRPPAAAQAPVTFWLSAPQPGAIVIPAGTAVATTQTETSRSIVFSTDQDLVVHPPLLKSIGVYRANDAGQRTHEPLKLTELKSGVTGPAGWRIFSSKPQVDDAIYFGFDNNLANHILRLELKFNAAYGAGIRPDLPPLAWEVAAGDDQWAVCEVDEDTTRGFNLPGHVQLHLAPMQPRRVEGQGEGKPLYWLRARVRHFSPEERRAEATPYDKSPHLRQLVAAVTMGGTVTAMHASVVAGEVLGRSDGTPGQRFQLQAPPILARQPGELLYVRPDGNEETPSILADEAWSEVPDFTGSAEKDAHYMLDSISGEVRFGPAVRQPNGVIQLYGRVPPRGATLIFRRYRQGGGVAGNVERGALNVLKTAIPFVRSVRNRQQATGGVDAESLEAAMMRVPALLSARQRAVCAADFEYLACETPEADVGPIHCLDAGAATAAGVPPGHVQVLVMPGVPKNMSASFLAPEQLELPAATARAVERYLQDRCLLTTRVAVRPPRYIWAAVRIRVSLAGGDDSQAQRVNVQDDILRRLYRFLNPITGGHDGKGWPFGRNLFPADIYQHLGAVPGLYLVHEVELYAAADGGERTGDPLPVVEVPPDGMLVSGLHHVRFG
jgi:predicted phage baseplate assembly protein